MKATVAPLNPLTMIWDGGAPATDMADLSRFWATFGQRDGLNILVKDGGLSQADHCETVER